MAEALSVGDIRKIAKLKELVIGTNEVVKNLKIGKVNKVYMASNCEQKDKESIEYYAGLSKAEVFYLEQPNDELGIICKKPYPISVMALSKGGK